MRLCGYPISDVRQSSPDIRQRGFFWEFEFFPAVGRFAPGSPTIPRPPFGGGSQTQHRLRRRSGRDGRVVSGTCFTSLPSFLRCARTQVPILERRRSSAEIPRNNAKRPNKRNKITRDKKTAKEGKCRRKKPQKNPNGRTRKQKK